MSTNGLGADTVTRKPWDYLQSKQKLGISKFGGFGSIRDTWDILKIDQHINKLGFIISSVADSLLCNNLGKMFVIKVSTLTGNPLDEILLVRYNQSQ